MSIGPSTSPRELIRRLLALTSGLAPAELAGELGVESSYVGKWRKGQVPGRVRPDLRAKLIDLVGRLEYLERGPMPAGKVSEGSGPEYSGASASVFVEHVLFTAGRIAELANQIARSAQHQITMTEEQRTMSHSLAHHAQRETPLSPEETERRVRAANEAADVKTKQKPRKSAVKAKGRRQA